MKDRERRELVVIERELRAEAPELVALFDPPVRRRGLRTALWLAGVLLPLSAFLDDMTVLLGALALVAMSVVPWTVRDG